MLQLIEKIEEKNCFGNITKELYKKYITKNQNCHSLNKNPRKFNIYGDFYFLFGAQNSNNCYKTLRTKYFSLLRKYLIYLILVDFILLCFTFFGVRFGYVKN